MEKAVTSFSCVERKVKCLHEQIFIKTKNVYQGRMISLFQKLFLSCSLSRNVNERHRTLC